MIFIATYLCLLICQNFEEYLFNASSTFGQKLNKLNFEKSLSDKTSLLHFVASCLTRPKAADLPL